MTIVRFAIVVATAFGVVALSFPAAAQPASEEHAGVGRDRCALFNERTANGGTDLQPITAARAAQVEYQNWFMGWLSGFNVGSSAAGLGAIDLEDNVAWYSRVSARCREAPDDAYAAAVLEVARAIVPLRGKRASRTVVGFGLAHCGEVNERSSGDTAYAAGGYPQWMYGYLTGYNAARADIGLRPIDLGDEVGAFASTEARCKRDSRTHLNSAVSVWVLEAETAQGLGDIPSDPTQSGLTFASVPPAPTATAALQNMDIGDWPCQLLMSLIAEGGEPAAVFETQTIAWIQGYFTAGDFVHAERNEPWIQWHSVDFEDTTKRIELSCTNAPESTLARVVADVERSLSSQPREEPSEIATTLIGVGSERCSDFIVTPASNPASAAFFRELQARLFATYAVQGWVGGLLGGLRANIELAGRRIDQSADLGQGVAAGKDAVLDRCTSDGALRIGEVAFGFAADFFERAGGL